MATIAYSVSVAPQYWTFNPGGRTKLTAVWRDANAELFKTHTYFSSSIIPSIELVYYFSSPGIREDGEIAVITIWERTLSAKLIVYNRISYR